MSNLIHNEKPSLPLILLSKIYLFGWKSYEWVYKVGIKKRKKPSCKIIGIGNLTVGGTGKTPFVIALVKALSENGIKCAVSCSGYGGKRWREITLLNPKETLNPKEIGEEPALIRQSLPNIPIVIGKKRLPAVRAAYQRWKLDVILLDDGFQHLPLARDIDIVLLDAEKPLSNSYTLPAGSLREPITGLSRASAVVWMKKNIKEKNNASLNLDVPQFYAERKIGKLISASDGTEHSWAKVAESGIMTVSALGNPEQFENSVEAFGASILKSKRFNDHHFYTNSEINEIEQEAKSINASGIITTAKDWVKIKAYVSQDMNLWHILELSIELEKIFIDWIISRLSLNIECLS